MANMTTCQAVSSHQPVVTTLENTNMAIVFTLTLRSQILASISCQPKHIYVTISIIADLSLLFLHVNRCLQAIDSSLHTNIIIS